MDKITDKSLDSAIKDLALKKSEEKSSRKYIDYDQYVLTSVKKELASRLSSLGVKIDDDHSLKLEIPPSHLDLDLAFSLFGYAKVAGKSPADLASLLAGDINTKPGLLIQSAEATGGYLNLTLNKTDFYKKALNTVMALGDDYGQNDLSKDKTVFIDYSSPNIAKPLGVGHLRSTVIGEALARIYQANGFTVIRDNHLGDWGTQFGSLIYAYKKWGDEEKMNANPIEELKNLYVRFTSEAEKNPELKEEAKQIFSMLEGGDPELKGLWKKFRDLSVKEFERTYDELNIKFDMILGESFYAGGSEELVEDLRKKGLVTDKEDGAVAVESLEKVPSFLIKKNDGSTLYVLRDLLAILHRRKVFNPDIILYVVGLEQELNFRQLFALAKSAGYAEGLGLRHIGFGLVMVDGKKMSTRRGTLVNLNEVLDEVTSKAKEIMIERGDKAGRELDNVARRIAISATIYSDLRQNRNSDVDFNWEKMLNLESGSVVYLQYAYARILSILNKSEDKKSGFYDFVFEDKAEFDLAKKLSFYPEILIRAIDNDAPHLICEFLEELATEINSFYDKVYVLATKDENLRSSRLKLLESLSVCVKNALTVLNIPILERL